jgi:cellulose synthase/poly-beta-1,6-N-acetylglucosamine synthase-like glycosyltransferase
MKSIVFILALVLFCAIFAGLTLTTGLLFIDWRSWGSVLYFGGVALMYTGVAYDLTESLLCLVLSPVSVPRLVSLRHSPPVALVMTICDDLVPQALRRLGNQSYQNYDIFILDDSTDATQRARIDQAGHTVLRRGTRRGYKAGNLNHWLDNYGEQYKYVVVLDSDSLIPNSFVSDLVAYAEHPENDNVAVFQAKILTWNTGSLVPRTLGALAPLRMYVLERFANWTGTMLSWGHNNLIRCRCLRQVGGFHEYLTCEDTVLSLSLSALGYTVRLVDVLSFESEPQDIFRYTRRATRWARQTVETFRFPWRPAALRLKLLLCYQLYTYLSFGIYLGLLLAAAWHSPSDGTWHLQDYMFYTVNGRSRPTPWLLVMLAMTGLWSVQMLLRLILVKKAGVSLCNFGLHLLLSTSMMYFVGFRSTVAMLRTAFGARTAFHPTNVVMPNQPTFAAILAHLSPALVCGGLVVAGIVLRNRFLLLSLNSLLLFLLLAAPVTLWLFHNSSIAERGGTGSGL